MKRLRRMGWLGAGAVAVLASPVCSAEHDAPRLYLPFAYPSDGSSMMGEAFAGPRSPIPGITVPLVPPVVTTPEKVPEVAGPTQILDDLFRSLAATQDTDEGKAIASQIGALWLRSGSETADLLMSRALQAYHTGNPGIALDLLDRLVVLQPDWAEAWDKRAFMRFVNDDRSGAMEDIAHVLCLEPRHFVALASMAMILRRDGMQKEALAIFRKAAAIYPADADVRQMISQLIPIVAGRPN